MQFFNGAIAPLVIEPLKYHFSNYTKATNIFWHEDEKLRTIDIGESFDFNGISLQKKPRIIVTRGPYVINKVGLTDNLAEGKPIKETLGLKAHTNMVTYSGSATITIEARQKGTCELITDMVSHFITWTRPVLCDSQGWKEFGLPMAISDIEILPDEEPNVMRYRCNISIPWMKEEQWVHTNDGIILKGILNNLFLPSTN